jgi:hypothetical protein
MTRRGPLGFCGLTFVMRMSARAKPQTPASLDAQVQLFGFPLANEVQHSFFLLRLSEHI